MSEERKGLRAIPPALLLAFAIWIVMTIVRLVYMATHQEWYRSVRFSLVSEGIGFATYVLATLGSLDLARRLAGRAALGMKIATIGFACALALDVAWGVLTVFDKYWEHAWLPKTFDYLFFATWFTVPVGFAVAVWHERVERAATVLLVGLLTFPPPFLAKPLYAWLEFTGKDRLYFDGALRCVRIGVFVWVVATIARGVSAPNRTLAALGMRNAAKALWLRVIAAVAVVLLTLMVVAGKGGEGSVEVLKLAMVSAAVINIMALVMFGLGALRAARAEVEGLGRWPLVLAATTSLWGAGVTLAQLPFIYKMLYKTDSLGGAESMQDYAQALAIAMPLVILAGIAAVAFVIGSFANHRGDAELAAQAQAKGAGFVALTLVAFAIQQWMLPEARSLGSFAMLSLLAAGAGLVATAMMASLCGRASVAIESEPGLPTATVVES